LPANKGITQKVSPALARETFQYNEGLVRLIYFLLIDPAAGDEPEMTTLNIDLNKRKKLKEGL
jgi:hypothetical protein